MDNDEKTPVVENSSLLNPFADALAEVFGRVLPAKDHSRNASKTDVSGAASDTALASAVSELTTNLGLPAVDVREDLMSHVSEAFESIGVPASVVSFRYGTLVLSADPISAALLRMHTEQMLRILSKRYGTSIKRVVVKVAATR